MPGIAAFWQETAAIVSDPFLPHPFLPHPSGPHPFGPHPFGPHPFGPHPSGPHPFGPGSVSSHRKYLARAVPPRAEVEV
jgi:hypothetical protein